VSQRTKRVMDCTIAVVVLIFCFPFFLTLAFLVAMDGGPVFYRHKRIGRGGRLFDCYKFRTMIVGAHDLFDEFLAFHPSVVAEWQEAQKLDLDPRITSAGRFLRRTSLDEMPQLLNVIRGEMSLVGPRPVTQPELQRYGAHVREYLTVRPGLTGLWQVSGRNRLTYAERVALDVRYIHTRSIWFDFGILLRTIVVLLRGDGK
jgi:exopolysaccharide production protein ExoY